MSIPSYQSQGAEPLYPNVLFNRPVTRHGAGRMLVTGGHTGEFSQPVAYNQLALAAGIGECNVIMPDKLAAITGGAPGVYLGASTTSGSLARAALGRILELSEEADVLSVGLSLSGNSDTTMLIERLVTDYTGRLAVFEAGFAALKGRWELIANRSNALLILTMPEVFKLCGELGIAIDIRPGGGLINKLEIVSNLAARLSCDLAVWGTESIISSGTKLSVTPLNYRLSLQPAVVYAVMSTFWTQNPQDRFAGLTTGAYVLEQAGQPLGPESNPTTRQLAHMISRALRAGEDKGW